MRCSARRFMDGSPEGSFFSLRRMSIQLTSCTSTRLAKGMSCKPKKKSPLHQVAQAGVPKWDNLFECETVATNA
jgi:hypothetical protein